MNLVIEKVVQGNFGNLLSRFFGKNFMKVTVSQCESFANFPPRFFLTKFLIFWSNQRTKENYYKTAFSKLLILLICGDLRRCLLNKSCRAGFGLLENIETCRTSMDAMGLTNA